LFADSEARVIGAAHAGWRGALTGVLEATIAAMEQLGARREHVAVALGPMIRQPNYEVGPEFVARFREADQANDQFFAPAERAGHAMFDLAGYAAARLKRAGITQIEDLGLCTYAEPERFFSYRRMTKLGETDYGRHINAIALDR
jgi:YfiH family protein